MKNKKGSVAVFLLINFLVSVFVIGTFGEIASGIAARSFINAVIDLAGRSVLSEYDRYLKDRYGLFGMLMEPEAAESRLNFYILEGFGKKQGKIDLFDLSISETCADMSCYALTNEDLLEEQIVEYMNHYVRVEGMSIMELLLKTKESDDNSGASQQKERELFNEKVIHVLPSRLLSIDQMNYLTVPSLDNLTEKPGKHALINLYIIKKFRHHLTDVEAFNSFFANEVEYILFGKIDDKENRNLTKNYLLALRSGINAAHILSDPEKRELIAIAANIIAPGPGAAAAQLLLIGTWAAAEASNDISRLEKGGRVPLLKTSDDWMTDLDSAMNNIFQSTSSVDADTKGLSYEGYLLLMLFFESREAKLARVMDLIQLNMQGGYCETFKMYECYGGLDIDCKIGRRGGFLGMTGRRTGSFRSSHAY